MKSTDILTFLKRRAIRQVATLYGAMVINLMLGVVVSIVNTRLLGPEEYGKFKLLGNLFVFVPTLINFGYFDSVGRLVAQRENEKMRSELIGAGLLLSVFIALLMAVILFGLSFVINDVFRTELAGLLRVILPLIFVFPLSLYLQCVCQGDNQIGLLASVRVVPMVLYLIGALSVYQLFGQVSLIVVLTMLLSLQALTLISASLLLGPQLKGLESAFSVIQKENRSFGIHIYLGAVGNVASAQLLGLFIGYFVDATAVGFYGLALAVCAPLTFIGSVIGTTHFKEFASQSAIPRKIIVATIGMASMSFVGFIVLVKPVMNLFYGPDFAPAITLAYIMGVGFLLHGLGDVYNRFLCAHGKGKKVRNGALWTGLVSLLAGVFLSKYFGADGAAWAKSITSTVYFLMMLWFYLKRK